MHRRNKTKLKRFDRLRSADQQINKFISRIEEKLDKYEKNLVKSEKEKRDDPEDSEEDTDLEGGNLDKRIDKIIRSYGISYNRCPRFFDVCGNIILSSRLITYKLIEQGIRQFLDKAEGKNKNIYYPQKMIYILEKTMTWQL